MPTQEVNVGILLAAVGDNGVAAEFFHLEEGNNLVVRSLVLQLNLPV